MNRMKFVAILIASSIGMLVASSPMAQQEKSEAQKTLDGNMENAKAVHERQEKAKAAEANHDTTHDGRLGVGTVGGHETSIGGTVGRDGGTIDVKISTDKSDKDHH